MIPLQVDHSLPQESVLIQSLLPAVFCDILVIFHELNLKPATLIERNMAGAYFEPIRSVA